MISSKKKIRHTIIWQMLLLDLSLSVSASLLSILFVKYGKLSGLLSGSTASVWIWLALAFVGTLFGGMVSGCWRSRTDSIGIYRLGKILRGVSVKEAILIVGLLVGLTCLPSWSSGVFAIVMDILVTVNVSVLSLYFYLKRRQKKGAGVSANNHRVKTAIVLGTNEESIVLADEAEAFGRYKVVGYLTANKENDGNIIGGRPVFWFQDSYDLNALFWRLRGIDNILVPREWDSAFKRKVRPQKPRDFYEDSLHKYLLMLNSERKS